MGNTQTDRLHRLRNLLLILALIYAVAAPSIASIHQSTRFGDLHHSAPVGARWTATEAPQNPDCFPVDVTKEGTWWVEIATSTPETSPDLVIFGVDDEKAPQVLGRTSGIFLHVQEPGEHFLCLTSQTDLDGLRLRLGLIGKGGDPEEIVIVIDPRVGDSDSQTEANESESDEGAVDHQGP